MIVIFEGPRLVGKTTIIAKLNEVLSAWGLPVETWKDTRGEDPVQDMNAILDEGFFTEDKIWLLDRFHMSEWVISKATRRDAYPGSEWAFYQANLQAIDERLAGMNALIILITSSPWFVDQRATLTGKKDPIGDGQKAQYWWLNTIGKTVCDMIHVINDKQNQLERLCFMLADIIAIRWSRQKPKEKKAELEEMAKELDPDATVTEMESEE